MLELKPSRALWAWWCALHALLATATLLVAAPAAVKVLALLALAGHAVVRRPRAAPSTIHVAADGSCAVPEWRTGNCRLGAGTLICPFWVKLDLGPGLRRRYILLIADQVGPLQWRRLRAVLRRATSQ